MTYFRPDEATAVDLANRWFNLSQQGWAQAIILKRERDGLPVFALQALVVPYIHEDSALEMATFTLQQAKEGDALIMVRPFNVDDIFTIEDIYPDEIDNNSHLIIKDATYVVLAVLLDSPNKGVSFGKFKKAWEAFNLHDEHFVLALKYLSESGMISVVPPGFVWLASTAREVLGEDHETYSFEFIEEEE